MSDTEALVEGLWESTRRGAVDEVRSFLERGADPNHQLFLRDEWTGRVKLPPLHTACKNGNIEMVKILAKNGANFDMKDGMGLSPLDRVLENQYDSESYVDVAYYVISQGHGDNGERGVLLCGACRWGRLDVAKEMVEQHKVDPSGVRDYKGRSPLSIALHNMRMIEGSVGVALYLISRCCGNDDDKVKLLFGACRWGRLDVVKELVEQYSLDPSELTNNAGETLTQVATRLKHTSLVEYLKSSPPSSSTGQRGSHSLPASTKTTKTKVISGNQPPSGTLMSEEETDALRKLLENENIQFKLPPTSHFTFERIQKLLFENRIEKLATNLRTKLDEVIEQQRYLKRLEDLLTARDSMDLLFLKVFLVGPVGVGKTTTLNRLLRTIDNILSAGDKVSQLPSCVQILTSITDSTSKWLMADDVSQEVKLLSSYLHSSLPVPQLDGQPLQASFPVSADPFGEPRSISTSPILHADSRATPYWQNRLSSVKEHLRKIVAIRDYAEVAKALGNTLLNFIDIEGQPGFLEMLPALSRVGLAMHLVFLDSSKDLKKPFEIVGSEISPSLSVMQTVEAMISQILSAIASYMSCPRDPAARSEASEKLEQALSLAQQIRPVAALISTHKDKVGEEELKQVNNNLEKIAWKFKEILVFSSVPGTCFFPLDNYFGTEETDMGPLRSFISETISTHFKEGKLPIYPKWLILGTVLRKAFQFAKMNDCFELGEILEMDKIEVKACLRYLNNIGSLMLFTSIADDEEGWFKDHVICSPQVIFDSISQLIIASLEKPRSRDRVATFAKPDFSENGLFSLESVEECSASCDVTDKLDKEELIPISHLVKLLGHVNLLSSITRVNRDGSKRVTYFMPAVLECASPKELPSPPLPDDNNPEPLFITFDDGYAPMGTFCGLITRLVSLGSNEIFGVTWELVEEDVKRNCVSFYVDYANVVTLISHDRCYEIRIERKNSRFPLHDLCTHSLSVILYVLRSLYENLLPQIAFLCPCPKHVAQKGIDNLAVLFVTKTSVWFSCERSSVELRDTQKVWLGKPGKLGSRATLEVLKFAEDDFSFCWSKEGSKYQIQTTVQPNALTFQSVCEEDLGYYRCEVKEAGRVVFSVYRAFYKESEEEDILGALRRVLWDMRARWKDLGIDLGISVGTLEAIELENGRKVGSCFTALLKEWLDKKAHDPQPGVLLLESLRGPVVHRADLADVLERKIKTGEIKWH